LTYAKLISEEKKIRVKLSVSLNFDTIEGAMEAAEFLGEASKHCPTNYQWAFDLAKLIENEAIAEN